AMSCRADAPTESIARSGPFCGVMEGRAAPYASGEALGSRTREHGPTGGHDQGGVHATERSSAGRRRSRTANGRRRSLANRFWERLVEGLWWLAVSTSVELCRAYNPPDGAAGGQG